MSRLAEAEHAIGQAETAIATLHTTLSALVETEAAIARARKNVLRPRTLLIAGGAVAGLVIVAVTVRKLRSRRAETALSEELDPATGIRAAS